MLEDSLQQLLTEGFSGDSIVILSQRSDESSLAALLETGPLADVVRPYGRADFNHIRYCSVHAFKGLEAAAIVLTDVESISHEFAVSLFYVSVTRVLQRLIVLAGSKVKAELTKTLLDESGANPVTGTKYVEPH